MNYNEGCQRIATILTFMFFIFIMFRRYTYQELMSYLDSAQLFGHQLRPIIIGVSSGLGISLLNWIVQGFRKTTP